MELFIPEARDMWVRIQKGEGSLDELIDSIKWDTREGDARVFFFRAYAGLSLKETAPILFQGRNIMGELGIRGLQIGISKHDGRTHLLVVDMLDGSAHFMEDLPD